MRKVSLFSFSVLSILALIVAAPCSAQLSNPSFESGSLGAWTGFGSQDGVQALNGWFGGIAAHDGTYGLGSAASYGTKDGGVYQSASDGSAGANVTVTAWTHNGGDTDGSNVSRIGVVDGVVTDPGNGSIQWSGWEGAQSAWTQMTTPQITLTGTSYTVFLQIDQLWANVWNINRIDYVQVTIGGGAPTTIVSTGVQVLGQFESAAWTEGPAYDAGWGGSATWAYLPHTDTANFISDGNCVRGSRSTAGASVIAGHFTVTDPGSAANVRIFMAVPNLNDADSFWIETGLAGGAQTAAWFDGSGNGTLLKKFDGFSGGHPPDNDDVWTEYSLAFDPNDTTLSVGLQVGQNPSGSPTCYWDLLSVDSALPVKAWFLY